jgi:hypothetical protein
MQDRGGKPPSVPTRKRATYERPACGYRIWLESRVLSRALFLERLFAKLPGVPASDKHKVEGAGLNATVLYLVKKAKTIPWVFQSDFVYLVLLVRRRMGLDVDPVPACRFRLEKNVQTGSVGLNDRLRVRATLR